MGRMILFGILCALAGTISFQVSSVRAQPAPQEDFGFEKAKAECLKALMPSSGYSPVDIIKSDSFRYTPDVARRMQDCVKAKGYTYNSPTAGAEPMSPDADKDPMTQREKEYYSERMREDIRKSGIASRLPPEGAQPVQSASRPVQAPSMPLLPASSASPQPAVQRTGMDGVAAQPLPNNAKDEKTPLFLPTDEENKPAEPIFLNPQ